MRATIVAQAGAPLHQWYFGLVHGRRCAVRGRKFLGERCKRKADRGQVARLLQRIALKPARQRAGGVTPKKALAHAAHQHRIGQGEFFAETSRHQGRAVCKGIFPWVVIVVKGFPQAGGGPPYVRRSGGQHTCRACWRLRPARLCDPCRR
eukprot:GHVR01169130.1.p2 GENE.GHVR01169130.1~~GHVR01169130.1.p2  ORF type:complete len:150 (+),score=13.33 GHVR01169130.1:189-638(+)